MSLWRRLISPRSAEETRGERSDNDDSVAHSSASAPPARRERARLQRRVGATAPATSTKKTPPRGTRCSDRIRNLQAHASRALGITRSSAPSPETTVNTISTECPSTPPVTSAPPKREQANIEEQTPTQQDLPTESPPSSPPGTIKSVQREKRISETPTPNPELDTSLLDPPSTTAQFRAEDKAPGSILAPVFFSPAIEVANTLLQSTAKDRSTELSAPSSTVPESSSSLLSSPDIIVQFQDNNISVPINPLYSISQHSSSPIGPSTPVVQKHSSPLLNPPGIAPQVKDEHTSAATQYLYSIPQYHSSPVETVTPAVPQPISSLLNSPDIIAHFQDEDISVPTNPLCSTPQHHSSPIGPPAPALQNYASSPLNPPSNTPQGKDKNPFTPTVTQFMSFIPQYHSSPIETTIPAVPQSTSSPFNSSPIGTPTGAAATQYLYSIPQYYSPSIATTPSAVPQSTFSPLSSPSSIAQFQGVNKSVLTSPQYHSSPIGTPTAAEMPKSRKRKGSSIDLEPPRTPKRRSPGTQKHDLNISKQPTPPDRHSGLLEKRKRNKLDEGLVCSSVAESLNGDTTSSESANSLPSDNGSGDDYEPDSSHNQRRSESPSPSPSPPKRAKNNPKQQVNGKKQDGNPRSINPKTKASAGQTRPNDRGKERSNDNDERYVDVGQSDESDYRITSAERNDLLYELTRERASRMAEAVEIPPDSGLGPVQITLVRKLATRGCKPVMSRCWASDFTTWPESLFTTSSDRDSDSANGDVDLMFRSQNMSDNYAIKALQELFAVSGRVRDCSLLSVEPQFVVGKAIRQYLHWAIDDAGLKTTGQTIPVHCICPQIPGEEIFATIMRCSRKLERLAKRHQMAHVVGQEAFWPTMIGFVIAGPIVCLLSLDTDPNSEVWSTDDSTDEESPAKYLTQFDLSEREQDVWNSLAVAICVVHLRDTLIELARSYPGSRAVPIIRGLGDETDDEDL